MSYIKKISLAVFFFALAPVAFAATPSTVTNTGHGSTVTNTGPSVTLINPLKAGYSLSQLLSDILSFVVEIGTVVIVLMVIFVGYKFVMAQGSDTKLIEARKMLLWTIVGALILLGAQAIAAAIQATVVAVGG